MSVKTAAAQATRVLIIGQSGERPLALRAELVEELDLEPANISVVELSAALRQVREGVVVIIDAESEQGETAGRIAELGAAIIVLAENPEPNWVGQLLAAGVSGVLRRDGSGRQLAAAVQAAAAGLTALEPETLQALMRPAMETIELEPGEEELTPRETEVLGMMTEGLSNREIASTLGISEHTVKFHITSIFGKLGTSSRTEAVTEGIRRGLVLL
ncbi:MAG TPA: response regulator transcription factor [Terriglobales bacterium]|nr:response regulator transcription factor [Terriglobales bacterium]